MKMTMGTKSLLFGAHQFLIHPVFVAIAWAKLYGFPWDPRLWVAFFVHDLGYFGKPNIDGTEGERHVEVGARITGGLFDWRHIAMQILAPRASDGPVTVSWRDKFTYWRDLCLYHSRTYARHNGKPYSRLCVADKFAFVLTPKCLYLPLVKATGELVEYMARWQAWKASQRPDSMSTADVTMRPEEEWFYGVKENTRKWVARHRNGESENWMPQGTTTQTTALGK